MTKMKNLSDTTYISIYCARQVTPPQAESYREQQMRKSRRGSCQLISLVTKNPNVEAAVGSSVAVPNATVTHSYTEKNGKLLD